MQGEGHVSVLLEEAIRFLNLRPGGRYMDATLGYAGHATAIAKAIGKEGELLGFDRDPATFAIARGRLEGLGGGKPESAIAE